jgi:RNA-directed DNA polymerase
VKFIQHRVGDKRVVHLIQKWLKAGVLEEGSWTPSEEGTPQGGLISPVLANIYLHYAFDLWAHQWRRQKAHGEVVLVRYADDLVVGFQQRTDAEQFQCELTARLHQFNLELHADKTRLIEFGRYAAGNRAKHGEGQPETFHFLGFTHICGTTRKGRFTVLRQTMRKRMRAKLKTIKLELKQRLDASIPEQGKWLRSVVMGHNRYYGVPRNRPALKMFHRQLVRLWKGALDRRSQRSRITWERMSRLARKWLPSSHIYHPYPDQRSRYPLGDAA